ncbi:MAG TPA: hypothetical protein VJV78_12340 [Polyangiales bacterium]|nr:hypothetical protein [Polyangiales bacterium]
MTKRLYSSPQRLLVVLSWAAFGCSDSEVPTPGTMSPEQPQVAAGAGAGAPAVAGAGSGAAGMSAAGSGTAGSSVSRAGSAAMPPVAGAPSNAAGAGAGAGAGAAGASGPGAGAGSSAGAPAAGSGGTADCDRACLVQINTDYLTALTARDAKRLATADKVRFTENGKDLPLTDGLWKVAMKLNTYRQDFSEAAKGQTGGYVVLDDSAGVVLLSYRMKVVDRKVAELETIVARQGQATFFSPSALRMNDPMFDMALEMSERSPRMKMMEIVDTYFQGIESGNGSAIPVDSSAVRNENGATTASGSGIKNLAMFSYIEEVTRRYIIVDEERGVVFANILFQIPMGLGGSRTLHLSELFKVKSGKLMKIEAFMVNQPLGAPSGWENDGLSWKGMGISP